METMSQMIATQGWRSRNEENGWWRQSLHSVFETERRAFLNTVPSAKSEETDINLKEYCKNMLIKIGTNSIGEAILNTNPVEATCRLERCLRKGKIYHQSRPRNTILLQSIFQKAGIEE